MICRSLDEVFRNLLADRPDLDEARLGRTRQLMNEAIRNVRVVGFEPLIDALDLPDPDDRHVLAAAIRCGAQSKSIVTRNIRDFPDAALGRFGIEAVHPDEFIHDLLDLAPGAVVRVLQEQADALDNPQVTLEELLETLERQGLVRSVAEVRGMLDA